MSVTDKFGRAEHNQTWSQWMLRAQKGERAVYEHLLRDIAPFIRSVARRHHVNRSNIDDVVQETLLTVHRVRHTYDPNRPFAAWLAAIASRRSIDALRRHMRISKHEACEESAYDDFSADSNGADMPEARPSANLESLLRRLPPKQRAALTAVKLKEMSLRDASALSGQSVGAVKVNVHRAMKTLSALHLADQS